MIEVEPAPISEQPRASGTAVISKRLVIEEKDVAAINVGLRAETQGRPTWRDDICYDLISNLWPAFICSFTCACIPLCQMANRLKVMEWPTTSAIFVTLIVLSVVLWMFAAIDIFIAVYFFAFYLSWSIRDRIRSQDDIGGYSVVDMTLSLFCLPCVVSHSMRHLHQYQHFIECDIGICSTSGSSGARNSVLPTLLDEDVEDVERCSTSDNVFRGN